MHSASITDRPEYHPPNCLQANCQPSSTPDETSNMHHLAASSCLSLALPIGRHHPPAGLRPLSGPERGPLSHSIRILVLQGRQSTMNWETPLLYSTCCAVVLICSAVSLLDLAGNIQLSRWRRPTCSLSVSQPNKCLTRTAEVVVPEAGMGEQKKVGWRSAESIACLVPRVLVHNDGKLRVAFVGVRTVDERNHNIRSTLTSCICYATLPRTRKPTAKAAHSRCIGSRP